MNIFKGQLYATSRVDGIDEFYRMDNFRILLVGDPEGLQDLINKYNMIIAGPMIPNYQTLSLEIDGLINEFDKSYYNSLMSPVCAEFFAAVLYSLYIGNNIILYFPELTKNLRYTSYLMTFIQSQFGITLNTKSSIFSYDESFNNSNLRLMYVMNDMSPQEFLLFFDGELDPNIFNKLIMDLNPLISDKTPTGYLKYLQDYKKSMIDHGGVLNKVCSSTEEIKDADSSNI